MKSVLRVDGHVHDISSCPADCGPMLLGLKARGVEKVALIARHFVWRQPDAEALSRVARALGIETCFGSEFYFHTKTSWSRKRLLVSVIALGYQLGHPRLNEIAGDNPKYIETLQERARTYLNVLLGIGYQFPQSPEVGEQIVEVLQCRIARPAEAHSALIGLICFAEENRKKLLSELKQARREGALGQPDMTRLKHWLDQADSVKDVEETAKPTITKLLWRRYFGPGTKWYQGLPLQLNPDDLRKAVQGAGGVLLLSLENPGDFKRYSGQYDGLADGYCVTCGEEFPRHPETGEKMISVQDLTQMGGLLIAGSDFQGLNREPGINVATLPSLAKESFERIFACGQ